MKEARVALMKTPFSERAGSGTGASMEKSAKKFQSHGVEVEEVPFPTEFGDAEALRFMHGAVTNGDFQEAFLREYQIDKTKLDPEICRLVENQKNYTRANRTSSLDMYARVRTAFDKITANYSAIITPSAVDEAPIGLGNMGPATFNFIWTVSS